MKMKKKGYAMGGMKKKGYAMGGMKKKMKAGGGVKKMKAGKEVGGPTLEGTRRRRLDQSREEQAAVNKKFAERGTAGAAEAKKQRNKLVEKSVADQANVQRYGKDAPKGRSFGQKTQPKQGAMKGEGATNLRKVGPGSDTYTTLPLGETPTDVRGMPMKKKGGSIKKMKAGGMPKKKGFAPGGKVAKKGKAKGGKSKVRGAGIAQRGVRPAQMR